MLLNSRKYKFRGLDDLRDQLTNLEAQKDILDNLIDFNRNVALNNCNTITSIPNITVTRQDRSTYITNRTEQVLGLVGDKVRIRRCDTIPLEAYNYYYEIESDIDSGPTTINIDGSDIPVGTVSNFLDFVAKLQVILPRYPGIELVSYEDGIESSLNLASNINLLGLITFNSLHSVQPEITTTTITQTNCNFIYDDYIISPNCYQTIMNINYIISNILLIH